MSPKDAKEATERPPRPLARLSQGTLRTFPGRGMVHKS